MDAKTGSIMTDERDVGKTVKRPVGTGNTMPNARRIGLAIGWLLSVGWLALVFYYINTEVGWGNLRFLLPHELAVVVAGVSGTLAALWLVIHFMTRGADLRNATLALQRELQKLTYPDEVAQARVDNLGEALQQQTRQLNEALQQQTHLLSEALERENQQLAEASQKASALMEEMTSAADGYSTDLKEKAEEAAAEVRVVRQDISANIDELIEIAGEAAARAKSLRGALSEHSAELAKTSDKVSGQVSEIGDLLGHDASLLRWLSTRMTERARKVRDSLATEETAPAGKAEPVRLHTPVAGGAEPGPPNDRRADEAPPPQIQSLGASNK